MAKAMGVTRRGHLSLGRLQRAVGRRVVWKAGAEPVPIDELVVPLRYDIMVRAEHFAFHEAHRNLYEHDFPAYEQRALARPYFVWFHRIAHARRFPGVEANDPDLRAAYRDRLHRSAQLFRGVEDHGFLARYPLSLWEATGPTTSVSGKTITRRFHPWDGCHRLALLLHLGHTVLPPDWYRIRPHPTAVPHDHTGRLIECLALSSETYVGYLSRGYADGTHTDAASLVAYVREHRPARLTELEHVLSVDQPALVRRF